MKSRINVICTPALYSFPGALGLESAVQTGKWEDIMDRHTFVNTSQGKGMTGLETAAHTDSVCSFGSPCFEKFNLVSQKLSPVAAVWEFKTGDTMEKAVQLSCA